MIGLVVLLSFFFIYIHSIYFVCSVGIVSVICLFVCFFFTVCNVSFCK